MYYQIRSKFMDLDVVTTSDVLKSMSRVNIGISSLILRQFPVLWKRLNKTVKCVDRLSWDWMSRHFIVRQHYLYTYSMFLNLHPIKEWCRKKWTPHYFLYMQYPQNLYILLLLLRGSRALTTRLTLRLIPWTILIIISFDQFNSI